MKKFKIKHGKKTYLVKAADKDSAMDKLVEKGFIEKMEDSDKLKQLAYEFGQKGAYFDRANLASSRNILGKDDEVKYQDFVNSGFKVYEQLKQEVDNVQKTGRSFGRFESYSDTLKLLKDGLERLYWASDNVNSSARAKGKALAEKLDNLTKEYWQRMQGIKDEESPERKAQEWVDYDLKHYGHVSEETKEDIKKMGLDFDKWDNQVKDAEIVDGSYKFVKKNNAPLPQELINKVTELSYLNNIKCKTNPYAFELTGPREKVKTVYETITKQFGDFYRKFPALVGNATEPWHFGQYDNNSCKQIEDSDLSNVEVKDDGDINAYANFLQMANKHKKYYLVKDYCEKILEILHTHYGI